MLLKRLFVYGILLHSFIVFPVWAAEITDRKVHKVVLQISDRNPQVASLAMQMITGLQQLYPANQLKIEVVAFGAGLYFMMPHTPEAAQIALLSQQNVKFSACGQTITGFPKPPILAQGVNVIPSGIQHIMELQEAGYVYLRP